MAESLHASLRRVLLRHAAAWLATRFGSLASDAVRPDSDLDLAVMGSRPLGTEEKTALITELAVASGRPVDLVDLPCTVTKPWIGPLCIASAPITGMSPATSPAPC